MGTCLVVREYAQGTTHEVESRVTAQVGNDWFVSSDGQGRGTWACKPPGVQFLADTAPDLAEAWAEVSRVSDRYQPVAAIRANAPYLVCTDEAAAAQWLERETVIAKERDRLPHAILAARRATRSHWCCSRCQSSFVLAALTRPQCPHCGFACLHTPADRAQDHALQQEENRIQQALRRLFVPQGLTTRWVVGGWCCD